jgi:hypothetical protein
VLFKLSSSDVGTWGMNTPGFFCIDNFTTQSPVTAIATVTANEIRMYPNPTSDNLFIDLSAFNNEINTLDVLDISGRTVETLRISTPVINLPVSAYKAGVYFVSVKNASTVINATFIKN